MLDLIRAGALQGYQNLLLELGRDPAVALTECGLTAGQLENPDRYVAYTRIMRAIEMPADLWGVRDFGLSLADKQNLDFLGPLSLAVQSAETVRDGLIVGGEYLRFHTPAASLHLGPARQAGEEQISFRLDMPNLPSLPQVYEHAVSHICKIVRLLSADALAPGSVHFRHCQQGSTGSYRKFLGQVPEFESEFDGITLNVAAARKPLPQSNPLLMEVSRRFLSGLAPASDQPVHAQVLNTLQQLMRFRPVGLPECAAALKMHPRTLQRKLQAEGYSFEACRDTVRKKLAAEYLRQRHVPLAHIAEMLGYADQAVLTRSCRRWFGRTPKAMRGNGKAEAAIPASAF